jgi:hypothetical protein
VMGPDPGPAPLAGASRCLASDFGPELVSQGLYGGLPSAKNMR